MSSESFNPHNQSPLESLSGDPDMMFLGTDRRNQTIEERLARNREEMAAQGIDKHGNFTKDEQHMGVVAMIREAFRDGRARRKGK